MDNSLNTIPRAPQGSREQYRDVLDAQQAHRQDLRTNPGRTHAQQAHALNQKMYFDLEYFSHLYAAGSELAVVAREVAEQWAAWLDDGEFIRAYGELSLRASYPLYGNKRRAVALAAFALLLVEDPAVARSTHRLVSPDKDDLNYLFDLLIKAFDPAHPLARKYKPGKFHSPWSDPVVRALALPRDQQAHALSRHMKNWQRLMRPFGWQPGQAGAAGNQAPFCDFAFEVALAVCGWDIDDTAFADHPYYPADLVRYYRANVRHARDAWRAEGAGAGVAIAAPAPPARSDLARSKRKGVARWVELASDGDQDATEAVLESIGKPRSVKDLEGFVQALGEAGIAVHADIKDDGTVARQAESLSSQRGLGEFDGPAHPSEGPARCTALLRSWDGWLASRNYRLIAIDAGDDAWHAVVVRDGYEDELQALSAELAIPLSAPFVVFED